MNMVSTGLLNFTSQLKEAWDSIPVDKRKSLILKLKIRKITLKVILWGSFVFFYQ